LLRKAGVTDFVIECLELSPEMLKRGRKLAVSSGVQSNPVFVQGDFNRWEADKQYAGIIANQSLHHVLEC
jgi:trans-aconitate methyltransferase